MGVISQVREESSEANKVFNLPLEFSGRAHSEDDTENNLGAEEGNAKTGGFPTAKTSITQSQSSNVSSVMLPRGGSKRRKKSSRRRTVDDDDSDGGVGGEICLSAGMNSCRPRSSISLSTSLCGSSGRKRSSQQRIIDDDDSDSQNYRGRNQASEPACVKQLRTSSPERNQEYAEHSLPKCSSSLEALRYHVDRAIAVVPGPLQTSTRQNTISTNAVKSEFVSSGLQQLVARAVAAVPPPKASSPSVTGQPQGLEDL